MSLHIPAADVPTVVTPASAGWQYSGLRLLTLAAGVAETVSTGELELFVLPLAGSARVQVAGGRRSSSPAAIRCSRPSPTSPTWGATAS